MSLKFTELEREALQFLLEGEDEILKNLKSQFNSATIEYRKFTGAGFYTKFNVNQVEPYHLKSYCFGDIHLINPELKNGLGFLIWVKNGVLDELESYTYGENFPEELIETKDFEIKYMNDKRNLPKLQLD